MIDMEETNTSPLGAEQKSFDGGTNNTRTFLATVDSDL